MTHENKTSILHRLDPNMRWFANELVGFGDAIRGTALSWADIRVKFASTAAAWNTPKPELPRVANALADGAFGPTGIRIYDPVGDGVQRPALIYFHGGGWVLGNLDTNDSYLRYLAHECGLPIVSVDYCLAPENKFPRPLEDCLAVIKWLRANAQDVGIHAERFALGGDSAGANLALACALDPALDGALAFCLLLFGVYGADIDTRSRQKYACAEIGQPPGAGDAVWDNYLSHANERTDPRAAPLLGDFSGLPAILIQAAEFDVFRDDSRLLKDALDEAGVACKYIEYSNTIHGFAALAGMHEQALHAIKDAANELREVFEG
jgi:acetyl esterase/lipase